MAVGLDIALVAAKSSLNTRQKEMAVLSNNISKANDPSYHRRTTTVDPNAMVLGDSGYFGTGCHVETILRNYDSAIEKSLRGAVSDNSYQNTYFEGIRDIEDILAPGGEDGLNDMIQDIAAKLQAIATSPEELANRVAFLRSAENLVDKFNQNYTNLAQLRDHFAENNTEGVGAITEGLGNLKSLLDRIPELNKKIASLESNAFINQTAGDLRDERDEVVMQIAEFIDIEVIEENDGRYTISCDGNMLVNGKYSPQMNADYFEISMANTPPSPHYEPSIVLASDNTVTVSLSSGKIKGFLDAREYIIEQMDNTYAYAENFGDAVDYPADYWESGAAYAVDDLVRPVPSNGYAYIATAAGNSGAGQPVWPTTVGDTVADGGVTWECVGEFSVFNAQHMKGYDLFGNSGGKVFTMSDSQPDDGNILSLSITDPKRIAASDVGDETAADPEVEVQKGNGKNMKELWMELDSTNAPSPTLSGESILSYSNRLIGDISQSVAIARDQQITTENIQNMFQNSVFEVSSVNLDEEMTEMLEVQRVYQATSKLMSTIDAMMTMVLNNLN